MPFAKGHKLSKGRQKGIKNNPMVMDVRNLLEDAFVRNQSAAIAKIDKMFQAEDNTDFKFLLGLKVALAPKKLDHTGAGFQALIVQYGTPAKVIESSNGHLNGHSSSV